MSSRELNPYMMDPPGRHGNIYKDATIAPSSFIDETPTWYPEQNVLCQSASCAENNPNTRCYSTSGSNGYMIPRIAQFDYNVEMLRAPKKRDLSQANMIMTALLVGVLVTLFHR
jgi:hypothetical protein